MPAFLLLMATGCGANREAEMRAKELWEARMKLLANHHKPLDKKIPLLAIKYGVPENVVREFVVTYEIDQPDEIFMKGLMATNSAELQNIENRLVTLPPISNTVCRIAEKHGIKPETIASLLIDYYALSNVGNNIENAEKNDTDYTK